MSEHGNTPELEIKPPPTTDQPDRELIRHPEFYYPNGDIAITCRDSQDVTYVFRIDRVYLSRNSPVFGDMFSLPSGSGSSVNEVYDGVTLFHLPDDADDFAALLKSLYDPMYLCLKQFHPDTPLKVTGPLRLATKYQMEQLRGRIIHIMETDWPTKLEDFMTHRVLLNEAYWVHEQFDDAKVNGLCYDDRYSEPASAIKLAKEFDIPSILPVAYYCLVAFLCPGSDWDETRRDDSSRIDQGMEQTARWDLLDREDLLRIGVGRHKLLDWVHTAQGIPQTRSENCTNFGQDPDPCELAREKIADLPSVLDRLAPKVRNYQTPNPIRVMRLASSDCYEWGLCDECTGAIRTRNWEKLQEFWARMPAIFGLS